MAIEFAFPDQGSGRFEGRHGKQLAEYFRISSVAQNCSDDAACNLYFAGILTGHAACRRNTERTAIHCY